MPHLALTLLTDVSFGDLLAALLLVGGLERLIYRLPATVVGPGGWLLDTGPARSA